MKPGNPLLRADGMDYLDEDGVVQRRPRNGQIETMYDLDHMSRGELRQLIELWELIRESYRKKKQAKLNPAYHFKAELGSKAGTLAYARKLFPSRPIQFRETATAIRMMAEYRLRGNKAAYEALYKALPSFAQFRRFFNVAAALRSQEKKS
jgi:hypothetical protein